MTFDPRAICRALNDAGVAYVVVGGFATVLHGSPLPTADVDVLPSRDADNLDRLATALRSLGARLRTEDGPVDISLDRSFLQSLSLAVNLTTDHGDVDLTFEPSGPRSGYDDWVADAVDVEIGDGLVIKIASLDAVIDSKRAANRPKDQRALPYLESLRDALGDPEV